MNERKIEENLMVGDLVYYSYPNQFVAKVIDICSHGEEPFIRCQRDPKDKLYVSSNFEDFHVDILSPIPLTSEILEKNGFTKYDVGHNVNGWTIMGDDNLYSAIPFTLTDNDFDTEPGEYKWGPIEDDREESFVREMGRINYVHELQHLLKLCKIEKEIVL